MTAVSEENVIQGSLREQPLASLLKSLSAEQRTGALSTEGGNEIWFSTGRIYLATTGTGPSLSAVLFGADIGSLNDIESLFALSQGTESVLDHVLRLRPDSEPLLRRLLHEYNLNSLFELLVPSEAGFRFEDDRRHRLGERFANDTTMLLAQAEHRMEIWRRIATKIPSTNAVFSLSKSLPGQSFERLVSADEWQYLALLNGKNTVADVITETGESAFRVCSTLYRLLLEDLVEEKPATS